MDAGRRGDEADATPPQMSALEYELWREFIQQRCGLYFTENRRRFLRQRLFGYLNLSDPNNYWISAQDIIFCQNVLLYFETEDRLEIVKRLCQRLNPGGYLFLGPAEIVGLKLSGIQPVRLTDVLIHQRMY